MHTTVKNTTGARRAFSFLPPHGRELDDNEEIEILGEVLPQIRTKRAQDAYRDAVRTGELEIVNTPAVLIQDDSSGDTMQLVLDTTLQVDDPRLPSL